MRTKFTPNEIRLFEEYAEIVLYDKNNNEKACTQIDLDVVPLVKNTKWYLRPDGYVATNNYNGDGYQYLHSIILSKEDNRTYVDHIDGDRLNNRSRNLREASTNQNSMNKSRRSNNSSGRTGVHWANENQKWCAMIGFDGKHINLGYFDTFEDAVQARQQAEEKYFGVYKPSERRATQ